MAMMRTLYDEPITLNEGDVIDFPAWPEEGRTTVCIRRANGNIEQIGATVCRVEAATDEMDN